MIYKLYRPLRDGREQLVAVFDEATGVPTKITGAAPVTMVSSAPPQLRTSIRPPKPKTDPELVAMQAKQALMALVTEGVPPVPTFEAILEQQKRLGLR